MDTSAMASLSQKRNKEAEEEAQQVRCMLQMHEDLCLDPSTPIESEVLDPFKELSG